ncbi:MAG TPA: SPOR domain-containing protein [Terriglobia bacterium]|nr:SPOR domain-containing protein [Terriglobia bacterium]
MPGKQGQQAELVLEHRQVVALFFGLALVCGVFFALGYVVGRNTLPPIAAQEQAVESQPAASEKPSAMPAPTYAPRTAVASAPAAAGSASSTELGFYDSVQQEQPQGILTPGAAPAGSAGEPAAPESRPAIAVVPPPAGIVVQVSALTRQEDAESLVSLLQEKNLPVLVTTGENDPLFHVVVGPYKSEAEAQKIKQLLEQDGFRPFLRR